MKQEPLILWNKMDVCLKGVWKTSNLLEREICELDYWLKKIPVSSMFQCLNARNTKAPFVSLCHPRQFLDCEEMFLLSALAAVEGQVLICWKEKMSWLLFFLMRTCPKIIMLSLLLFLPYKKRGNDFYPWKVIQNYQSAPVNGYVRAAGEHAHTAPFAQAAGTHAHRSHKWTYVYVLTRLFCGPVPNRLRPASGTQPRGWRYLS